MFKSPVLRSDWLDRVAGWAGTLMHRHSTSGRKVSRAGRGATQYNERVNQSERTRSQHQLRDWLERLSKWRAGGRGVVWTAARVLWFSVRRQSCHSSEGRLFSARRSGITNRLTKKQLATTNSSAFFTAFLFLYCPLRHNDACFLFTLEDAKGKQ